MALVKSYREFIPRIAGDVFLAENAVIIGEVEIGAQSSVWFHAVIRGDVGAIVIGERTSVQDFVMIHCTNGHSTTTIGNDVVIGHHAVLHGCTIGDECLIGMGAIVLDKAVVPRHTIVAAGALIPEGMVLESGMIYAGVPAQPVKALSERHLRMIRKGSDHYVEYSQSHRESRVLRPDEYLRG
ncbi:MAG: gamma carbonic anhydrase family protein [Bacteroidia bacterium]|nr:gamma carbonic anhydrase family protein [Bacteroidia bacterium]